MKKFLAMMLALVMVLSLVACGEKAPAADDGAPADDEVKTFVMGIDPEYPPFSYIDDNGEYSGFDVEVCKAACELLGWNFEVFGVNWDQKLVQMDAMECDCIWSGMTIRESMKEAGYVLSAPYYYNTQVILVKDDSGITTSADLAGKIVSVQLGTSGEALLAEGGDLESWAATFGELSTTDSFIKCFADLDGNAVDAVFVDLPVAAAYVSENEGFTIINENLGAEEYGIAFRSGDAEMCAQIEGAVAELVANGTYAEIAAKYPDIDPVNLVFLND